MSGCRSSMECLTPTNSLSCSTAHGPGRGSFRAVRQLWVRSLFASLALSARSTLATSSIRSGDADSMRWLMRQRCDPYVRRARIESYRCRSAFKLLQLHELIPQGLFHSGDIVVDCGAAPGSWSQVAMSHVCPLKSQSSTVSSRSLKPGLVIALDLLDFAPIPGVVRHQRTDLRDSANCAGLVRQSIAEHSDNPTAKVNIILSDMAPNASGLRKLDIPSMMILAHSVLQLAIRVSAPGACLVIKLWECQEAESFKKLVSRFYAGPWDSKSTIGKEGSPSCVQFIKPDASRKDSSEIYLVARGFCLPTLTVD
ncbi:23S rRNA (uridine2552-2'-O)-methyltransferase [Paragonimus westermani]|uniref:rRNA methyltransferase 2, mitochondrial n=1 Tax=Paragonimus westermani TaxID=34504 RepID=A0A5J4NB61_9TREM|nr:23S rRNA (uridine2552-2'-O)-methyltransferase [Paragonimus westermani]